VDGQGAAIATKDLGTKLKEQIALNKPIYDAYNLHAKKTNHAP